MGQQLIQYLQRNSMEAQQLHNQSIYAFSLNPAYIPLLVLLGCISQGRERQFSSAAYMRRPDNHSDGSSRKTTPEEWIHCCPIVRMEVERVDLILWISKEVHFYQKLERRTRDSFNCNVKNDFSCHNECGIQVIIWILKEQAWYTHTPFLHHWVFLGGLSITSKQQLKITLKPYWQERRTGSHFHAAKLCPSKSIIVLFCC